MPPRRFAVVREIEDEDPPIVVDWGLQLTDGAVFIWCTAEGSDSIAVVNSAEGAASLAGLAGPARLVWIDPAESIR